MPPATSRQGIEVRVEDDASVARIILWPDAEDEALNVDVLTALIRDAGVVIGPELPKTLERTIASFKSAREQTESVVAVATPVVHGRNGFIEWQPECDPNAHRPAAQGDGVASRIDYYNQASYIAVEEGQHIASIRPPVSGTDGCDVTGKPRKAKTGSAASVKTDPSLRMEGDGRLIALVDGVISFNGSLIKILPMFEIPGAVNFSTGNILFKGCVSIRGDVCDRFVVRAGEDISVQGVIGAATVICGGKLQVKCGMAANDRGCLFVGGDASVGYLSNVHGLVQGSLFARREIINCDLAVGQNLMTDSGAVIGGSVTVAGSAIIGTLGSTMGTATMIVFGTHPCSGDVAKLLHAGPAVAQPGKIESTTAALADQIRACADQCNMFTVGNAKPAQLTVAKMLHAGCIIKTGRTRVVIDKSMRGPIHIHGDQGSGLFYKMGDGVSHPLTDLARPMGKAG